MTASVLRAPIRRDVPTFAQLCVIVRYAMEAGPSLNDPDLTEEVKRTCARNRLLYDGESVRKAIDAVQHFRTRGQQ